MNVILNEIIKNNFMTYFSLHMCIILSILNIIVNKKYNIA